MRTTGKYSRKAYQCKECGQEKEIGTNHWGECYPVCDICEKQTVWECLDPMPKGYEKPQLWEWVTLGDLIKKC